jgi:excisionase family DNA binding protein
MSVAQTTEPLLLIKPREAARMLSVSEKTLWTLTKGGVIPVVRVGERSVRYSVAALERWIAEQQIATNANSDK